MCVLFFNVCAFIQYIFFSDDFNAVEIAEKLRTVADALNDDITFKAVLNDLKKAAAQEVSHTHAHYPSGRLCTLHFVEGVGVKIK